MDDQKENNLKDKKEVRTSVAPRAEAAAFAAVDAGSNAIRLTIVRADSPAKRTVLEKERCAVRFGSKAFTEQRLEPKTVKAAVDCFRRFRTLFDRHGVTEYRAVATSALRSAQNRREVLDAVQSETAIVLEVIEAEEESRLVREAVHEAMGDHPEPEIILDLGGGSLEISLMRDRALGKIAHLPLGTVRLMETFQIHDTVAPASRAVLQNSIRNQLRQEFPIGSLSGLRPPVACGGNAECLADIAPGKPFDGLKTLSLKALDTELPRLLGSTAEERMKTYGVPADRADVMAIAAVVLAAIGREFGVEYFLVPGVGVRDGILRELALEHFVKRTIQGEIL